MRTCCPVLCPSLCPAPQTCCWTWATCRSWTGGCRRWSCPWHRSPWPAPCSSQRCRRPCRPSSRAARPRSARPRRGRGLPQLEGPLDTLGPRTCSSSRGARRRRPRTAPVFAQPMTGRGPLPVPSKHTHSHTQPLAARPHAVARGREQQRPPRQRPRPACPHPACDPAIVTIRAVVCRCPILALCAAPSPCASLLAAEPSLPPLLTLQAPRQHPATPPPYSLLRQLVTLTRRRGTRGCCSLARRTSHGGGCRQLGDGAATVGQREKQSRELPSGST